MTLYPYSEADGHFGDKITAGRLRAEDQAGGELEQDDVRLSVVNGASDIVFLPNVDADPVMNGSRRQNSSEPFVKRERIESSVAIVLRANGERVGLLFINFRMVREFSQQERRLIEHLANASAVALRASRQGPPPSATKKVHSVPPIGGAAAPLFMDYDQARQVLG